jgi:hypothetical protein
MPKLLEPKRARARRTLRGSLAMAGAKAGVFTLGVAVALLGSVVVADLSGAPSGSGPSWTPPPVDPALSLIAEHRCSTTGFGDGETPASALLRHRGVVEQVSFARGWAAHEGREPGTLVAVCRAPLSR